jgi:hypothetical protein
MHHLNGLLLRLKGQIHDAFLYSGNLYLADDERIRVINFVNLIENIAPDSTAKRVLFKYAFLHNDFFYKADNEFYDFFNIQEIRNFLRSNFDQIGEILIPPKIFEKNVICDFEHEHPGIIHLEVYKNTIFLSEEKGTFAYQIKRNRISNNSVKLFDWPAVHIAAELGNTVYFACAEQGLISAYIPWFSEGPPITSKNQDWAEHIHKVNKPIISSDMAYRDLVIRDIKNNYYYGYDTSWIKDKTVSEQRESEDLDFSERRNYHSYDVISTDFLGSVDFASSTRARILTIKGKNVCVYGMNYQDRIESKKPVASYRQQESWSDQSALRRLEKNYIYSGYQTVFGLVLDTTSGTLVLDDDFDSKHKLLVRKISRDENVKVRHFYRAINYSHIVVSIKNNHIEFFSDLTDYFFPKEKKKIRKIISRREAIGQIKYTRY